MSVLLPVAPSKVTQQGPKFGKKSLSFFLRNDCPRQFRLSLYNDRQLEAGKMPPRSSNRPLSGQAAQAGDEWQDQVVSEVERIFGSANVRVSAPPPPSYGRKNVRPQQRELRDDLPHLSAHQFVVESIFGAPDGIAGFNDAFGLHGLRDSDGLRLEWSRLNPDIVQTLPPQGGAPLVTPSGGIETMQDGDTRLQLRIIDVKLASEPGAHYFGELAYYSIALASWLRDEGFDDRFVVSARAAVWPGSYERSQLSDEGREQQRGVFDLERLLAAMEGDLETIAFEVYASRLARFFTRELPDLLRTPWHELAWHPTFRCQNCDYLGYDWQARLAAGPNFSGPRTLPDPEHCWQVAERDDLISRVPGLTRGGAAKLRRVAPTVREVAALPPDHAVWDEHSNLRAGKAVFSARANALETQSSSVIAGSGACATVPDFVNLRLYLSVDYDPSSAITAAIALRGDWREPRARPETLAVEPELSQPGSARWGHKESGEGVWLIDARRVDVEEREFLRFLEFLQGIFDEVAQLEKPRLDAGEAECQARKNAGETRAENREKRSTFQIYLWDEAQFRHLQRLIARHLPAILDNAKLKGLAWLFPSPQLLPDEAMAGRSSPISLLSSVVDAHVAVPVAHHYTLLEVSEHFLPQAMTPPFVKWNFREPLTNLVPSERIHEYWARTPKWRAVEGDLEATARSKAFALSLVAQRVYEEKRAGRLVLAKSSAPALPEKAMTLPGVPDESRLWWHFARVNAAMQRIEAEMTYALPPETRELRGKAAHLTRLLSPQETRDVLPRLNESCGTRLKPDANLRLYALSPRSREVNMKPGEFGALLSPRDEPLFALQNASVRLKHSRAKLDAAWWATIAKTGLTEVDVEAIDRENLLVALRWKPPSSERAGTRIDEFAPADLADFSRDVMLDALPSDAQTGKIKKVLERIGYPPFELPSHSIGEVLPPARNLAPASNGKPAKAPKPQPAHDALWRAPELAQTLSGRASQPLRALLEAEGVRLNPSQWNAWASALERRLTLIWGPPGTGKSATLRAICRAAVLDAQREARPLRLLITAHTYTAVDELLHALAEEFSARSVPVSMFRLQSSYREEVASHSTLRCLQLDRREPCEETVELVASLNAPQKVVIVGTVPGQLHNLALVGVKTDSPSRTQQAWFDMVLLDEASQMDVGSSTLVWSKLAPNASVVVAGDDLQMSPIHQAEPPEGFEELVGSVYGYFRSRHAVAPHALNVNYRSNATVVECVRRAGYDASLQSHSPDLQLNLSSPLPVAPPEEWPANLPFSPDYATLLDPSRALGCFLYDDPNFSGQSNDFEAQTVAALLRLLYERLAASRNRRDADGNVLPASQKAYSLEEFWAQGVGVVAPHRAQGSKIVEYLRAAFAGTGATPSMIRDAVDTVERFQGQERDVIIASFGLGDPDMVALEDEFLFNLNRFNVLVSRARVKAVALVSRAVLDHLSDDQEVVRHSALLKGFVERACHHETSLELPALGDGFSLVRGEWRSA